MTLLLAYWIIVASIGLGAALFALRKSARFSAYLHTAKDLPPGVKLEDLLAANRLEIVRDTFLVAATGANVAIGIAAAFQAQFPIIKTVTGFLSLTGILVGATLIAGFAVLNAWTRHR